MLPKYLAVGIGGFVGANARFILAQWAARRWGTAMPYGTFIINISGSFILGAFSVLALRLAWSDALRLMVAIGFVGAYTTFSTFEYESLQLVMEGSWPRALLNIGGSVVCGFAAAYLGVVVARLFLHMGGHGAA